MSAIGIDSERWERVWSADLDVLRSLAENGDRPDVVREVDVSFRGDQASLKALADSCSNFGFSVLQFDEAVDDGQAWLTLVRSQTADEDAIRDLTITYLQIENSFGVECDGWGCVSQNDRA